jgi:RNA polymerase sigma factor (sigma-70 family)
VLRVLVVACDHGISRPSALGRCIGDVAKTTLPPFQAFMDDHRDDVWRFLVAVAGPQEADDCLQETFLSALRAYADLEDARNLKGWIMTIAYRKAMDTHRSRSKRPVPVGSVPEIAGGSLGPEGGDDELWDAVRLLPPMQRAAVAYRYVSDLPYKQIAQALSCSEDSARQNVRMGLRRLREVLSE